MFQLRHPIYMHVVTKHMSCTAYVNREMWTVYAAILSLELIRTQSNELAKYKMK